MQEFCSFAILPVRSNTRLTFRFQAVTWKTRKQPLSKDLLVISLSAVRRKGMKLCMITGICLCSKIRQFFLRLANQRYSEQYVMQASNSIKLSCPPPPPPPPPAAKKTCNIGTGHHLSPKWVGVRGFWLCGCVTIKIVGDD